MKKLLNKIRQFLISLKKTRGDLIDVFSPKNSVRITIMDLDGNIIEVIEGRNIVTGFVTGNTNNISGRDFLRRAIINSTDPESVSGRYVSYMKLGTGTDAETVNDTGLDTAISDVSAQQSITTTSLDPSDPDITFTASWGSSDANGNDITEVGLYSDQGDFLARKTFSSFNKTSAFTFQIEWTLRF